MILKTLKNYILVQFENDFDTLTNIWADGVGGMVISNQTSSKITWCWYTSVVVLEFFDISNVTVLHIKIVSLEKFSQYCHKIAILLQMTHVVIHIASLVDISQRAGWTGTAGPAHYFQHPIQDQQSLFHQFCSYQYFQNFFWSCDHNSENTQRTRWATTVRPAHCFQHHKNNIFTPFTIFNHFGTF